MMRLAWEILQKTLGLDSESLNAWQVSARAVAVIFRGVLFLNGTSNPLRINSA